MSAPRMRRQDRRPSRRRPPGPPRGVATMSIVRWVLVAITALVAVGSILSYAGVHLGGAQERRRPRQLYTCPMHPSIVQDHPGECPICSMTLVPKAHGANGDRRARPRDAKPAVARSGGGGPHARSASSSSECGPRRSNARTLGGELRTVGVIGANERGLAQINTRFAGWIQKLLVSETGERVRRGQVLATIYSPDVLRAEQELLVARGWNTPGGAGAKPTHEHDAFTARRWTRAPAAGWSCSGSPAQEIDEVLRTGKAVEAIAIRSPVDGYVVAKNAVAGVAVQPGTVLFEVADLSTGLGDRRDLRAGHLAHPRRPAGAPELSSFPGETHTGQGAVHLPDARRRQPHAARAARVQEQDRSQRPAPAARHVRHRLPRPAGARPASWSRPRRSSTRARCTTSSSPRRAATSSRGW